MKQYGDPRDTRQDVELLIDSKIHQLVNTNLIVKVNSLPSKGSNIINVTPQAKRSYTDKEGNRQYVGYQPLDVRLFNSDFLTKITVNSFGLLLVVQHDLALITNEAYTGRKFDLLDGVFLPINVSLGFDNTTTVINCRETLRVQNQTHELLALLKKICTLAKQIQVDPSTHVLIPTLVSQFTTLESEINTFVAP